MEFYLRFHDRTEYHQVKRQRTARGDWSISALRREGVLGTFLGKLGDSEARCTFVSAHSAASLEELSERARNSLSATEYELHLSTSQPLRKELAELKKTWGNPDPETTLDLLRRIYVQTIGEDSLKRFASVLAESILEGDQTDAIPMLVEVLLDNVQKHLTPHDLWHLLRGRGYKPALRHGLQQAAIQVNAANAQYEASRRETLIQGTLLPRRETDQLLGALTSNRLILLDGSAGMGKSDVLLQCMEHLNSQKTPHLAFRLDRTSPTRRPDELGRQLDLPASPAVTLAAVAQGREAILIIDQLDAVSTSSGRSPQFLECVVEIVRSAHAVPNLRIVLACRTFDFQHDARLRRLVDLGKDQATVTVGLFDSAQIQGPLSALGYPPGLLSDAQLELLRTPLHLALLAEATASAGRPLDFSTPMDLYNAFWVAKRESADARSSPSYWCEVIDRLVDYMSRKQVLSAPARRVESWEQYVNAMESEHVLTRDGQQMAFFHESFFDYAFARRFIAQEGSIGALLAQDQLLFRRAQVRQILVHERQEAPIEYKHDLFYLVRDPSVRFHLKDVVVSWLSQIAPTHVEWSLIEPLLMDEAFPLFGRAWRTLISLDWFKYADERGFVEKCVRTEDNITDRMISILAHVVKTLPERVVEILAPFLDGPRWRARIMFVLNQSDLGAANALFDLFVACVEQEAAERAPANLDGFDYVIRTLAQTRPDRACELLGRYFRGRAAVAMASGFDNPFDDHAGVFFPNLHLSNVMGTLGSTAPVSYIEQIWPWMLEIIARTAKESAADALSPDAVWQWRDSDALYDLQHSMLSGAESAFAALARSEPARFEQLVADCRGGTFDTFVYLLYRGFSANPERYAELAIEFLLEDRRRLQVRYSSSPCWATRQLLQSVTPYASRVAIQRLENVLLSFYPRGRWNYGWYFGDNQFELIGGIASVRRSPAVRTRIAEFQRKFRVADVAAPEGVIGGAIRSPITAGAARKMSDRQWCEAISRYAGSYRDRARSRDFLKGGAEQLASVLEKEAEGAPGRFAALALQFSDSANMVYFEAVLRGVAAAEEPLPLESIQALIERCHRLPGRPCGRWIARPLIKYAQRDLPSELLEIIGWYAINDPDPGPEAQPAKDPDSSPEVSRSDDIRVGLMGDGLNSVRGGVAADIARLIDANARHFRTLEPAIRRLVTDPAPEVRAMAAEIICVLVVDHPAVARSLFLDLVEDVDDRVLATQSFRRYLFSQGADEFAQLCPIIKRMIQSPFADVRQSGAEHATLVSLQREDACTLADACLVSEDEALRLGAAKVYSWNVTKREYAKRCSVALKAFFNDHSAQIRNAAGDAIWRMGGDQLGNHATLARAFLESAAFEANVDDLVHALTETTAAVPELIRALCERTLDAFEARRQVPLAYQAGKVVELVLRAYADTDDRAEKERVLDLIDRSLELDIDETSKLLVDHDRWC